MNTAKKGRRKEYQLREVIEAEGYYMVRSAASKGHFDLIALPVKTADNLFPSPRKLLRLIQVKPKKMGKKELKDLVLFSTTLTSPGKVEVWVVEDRKKPYKQFCLDIS